MTGRRIVALAAAFVSVAAAVGLAVVAPAVAAPGCRVDYAVPSQWQNGFTANVAVVTYHVTRSGTAVTGAPARRIVHVELKDALADRVVVLDGGMSTALELAGHDLSDALWSGRLLLTDPDAVRDAHLAFYRAGAEVAITASYQVTFEGFAKQGIGSAETARLLHASVSLARSAASSVDGQRWVAASVGPYGAMLADGSEYRGRYGLSVAELAEFHRPRIETLVEAAPDVLAVETIPDVDEAEAVLEVVRGSGVPVWLSYSIRGDRT
jgi:homocysteine S-methyltransferase